MHAEVSRISCHSGSIALLQQLNWRGLALPEVHNKDPAESMNSENMQNTGVCVCVFASSSLNMQTLLGLRCMWHCIVTSLLVEGCLISGVVDSRGPGALTALRLSLMAATRVQQLLNKPGFFDNCHIIEISNFLQ